MPMHCTRGAASVLGFAGGPTSVLVYQSPGVNNTSDASTLAARGAQVDDWLLSLTWDGFTQLDGVTVSGGSSLFFYARQLSAADITKKVGWLDATGLTIQPGMYYIVRGPTSVNNLVVNSLASGSPTTTAGYAKNPGWIGHLAVCLLYYSNQQTANSVTSPTQVNFGYANENVVGRTITGQLMLPPAPYSSGASFTWHGDAGASDPSDRLRVYEFRA